MLLLPFSEQARSLAAETSTAFRIYVLQNCLVDFSNYKKPDMIRGAVSQAIKRQRAAVSGRCHT